MERRASSISTLNTTKAAVKKQEQLLLSSHIYTPARLPLRVPRTMTSLANKIMRDIKDRSAKDVTDLNIYTSDTPPTNPPTQDAAARILGSCLSNQTTDRSDTEGTDYNDAEYYYKQLPRSRRKDCNNTRRSSTPACKLYSFCYCFHGH